MDVSKPAVGKTGMNGRPDDRAPLGAGAAVGDASGLGMDATDDPPVGAEPATPDPAPVFRQVTLSVRDVSGLDPMMQKLIAVRSSGRTTMATASTVPGEVAVVARVSDPEAWQALSEVRPGLVVASEEAGSDDAIVTGRIPLSRIEAVRAQPFVISLKPSRELRPALAAGVLETRADPGSLSPGSGGRRGAGVVVGVIDYGCDFAHQNFRTAHGTRIEAIWHQGGVNSPSAPFGYGALHERGAIDAALRQATPYATLGYGPARDTPVSQGTHGTHVLDIAAGNGAGSGAAGFAPEAAIIFVDVSSDDISWRGADVVGTSFGDSVRLLEAIQFVFDRAGDRPCVVNVSLGTNGGPHDGSTLVERGIDRLIRQRPDRAVVIAASNAYGDRIHVSGRLGEGESVALRWNRPPSAGWQDELEIWYGGPDRIAIELLMPDGSSLGVVEPGETGEAQDNGEVVALVANRLADPNNGDNMIGLFVDDRLPSGTWTIRLTARVAPSGGGFHGWIERDDRSQASFLDGVDDGFTIGSISCGHETIVVGSYDAHKPTTPLSWFSSAGPTRDGREKPELSAPGHSVGAAHSRTGRGVIIKSGTSMAAPAVAGAVALLLAEAHSSGVPLDSAALRSHLLGTLRSPPDGSTVWHPRWGGGRLDVAGALADLPSAIPTDGGGQPGDTLSSSPASPVSEEAAAAVAGEAGPLRKRRLARGRKPPNRT